MALEDVIKRQVANAKRFAKKQKLLVPVQHLKIIGRSAFGPVFATSPVTEYAIVEDKIRWVSTGEGAVPVSETKLTFLENIDVQVQEKYTLPDGREMTVLPISGMLDSQGKRYTTEVVVGE